ncbi:MAG: mandelate racemase/muconate lactonizing enzyme family protein [Proteobacteria bacterium]|nr:mandelate racemase/muconate lactonizing enzyme family protein [Pseudomonadota bacterium]
MKITGIETIQNTEYSNLVWVKIHTDEGITGLGETFRNPQAIVSYLHETCAPYLIGKDPLRINEHSDNLINWTPNRYIGYPTRSVEYRGNSAVDIALWDLKAKASNLSLVDMLGGLSRDNIPIYNTCAADGYNWKSDSLSRSVGSSNIIGKKHFYDDLELQVENPGELANSLLDEGISAMKIWPFDEFAFTTKGQMISNDNLKIGLSRIEKIRKAVGSKIDIMIEYHSLWQLAPALKIARKADEFDVFWHEDPINMAHLKDLADFRSKTLAPIAGSEALGTALWYRDALALNAIDYMHYDLGWVGGISEAIRIAGLAHANNRMMCPHDCTGPIVWIANLHISLAFSNSMILESVRSYYNGYYNKLVTNLPKIQKGYAFPMEGIGLGADLKDSLLRSVNTITKLTEKNDL